MAHRIHPRPRIWSMLAYTAATVALMHGSAVAFEDENENPADTPTKESDSLQVPDGTTGELLKFIETARRRPLRTVQDYKDVQTAILKASDKILESRPDEKTEVAAIEAKFGALTALARVEPAAAKKAREFAESLKDDPREPVAELARTELLKTRANRVSTLAAAERRELLDDVLAYLRKEGDLQPRMGVALSAARGLERVDRELAAKAYSEYAKILAKADDERLASYAPKMEGSARRVMLLGSQMEIKGQTLDGEPFRWDDYKGKVVLVDFWATWCGPCVAELPNVKRNYELYHDRGFEVVAISLDRSQERIEKFIKDKEIPWTNLFETDDAKRQGWDHPMATYYGVMAIPTVILVDQKGAVVSLNARGPELGRLLAKLLGPADGDVPRKSRK